jgi:hypothetical protein
MRLPPSRREFFVLVGLLVAGCGTGQAPAQQEHPADSASATVTLVVDGMI